MGMTRWHILTSNQSKYSISETQSTQIPSCNQNFQCRYFPSKFPTMVFAAVCIVVRMRMRFVVAYRLDFFWQQESYQLARHSVCIREEY